MKINWGTGIAIALGLFMSFILYFVFQMVFSDKYQGEMVVENYYEKESAYQGEVDAQANANALLQDVVVTKNETEFLVHFPKEFDYRGISGNIHLYRPSYGEWDLQIPIQLEDNIYAIPLSALETGIWDIMISWEFENVNYRFKKRLYN